MEDKNIFSKFTLETQTKYKKKQNKTCLQGLLPWEKYHGLLLCWKKFYHGLLLCWKIYSAEVSYTQNSDIREVVIAIVW